MPNFLTVMLVWWVEIIQMCSGTNRHRYYFITYWIGLVRMGCCWVATYYLWSHLWPTWSQSWIWLWSPFPKARCGKKFFHSLTSVCLLWASMRSSFLPPSLSFFFLGSLVAHAGLKLAVYLRMALNSWSSCFYYLWSTGVTCLNHECWVLFFSWDTESYVTQDTCRHHTDLLCSQGWPCQSLSTLFWG